ncbi:hypothetical protein [Achromobacter xylosoxidans]|uniref:hypothetical protein n=1 Tax=Alcaligenes xylosoxydans xylosoxydans TaxID=85698 RepID=UPI001F13C456|nr:hypothetical protein [Achromobacter xylosoxidans]
MVQLVQRPRGPEGHRACYAPLPWPSDVTQQQIDGWLREFKAGACSGPDKVKPPSGDKFWVLMPASGERFGVKADRMEMSGDSQSILLWRQGDLVAAVPATHLCVKDADITVCGLS